MKIDLKTALEQARGGGWPLRKINFLLGIGIPFNRPHRIRIREVMPHGVAVSIPYRRKNLNHVKGIHACALATGAEFCSGLMLLRLFDPRQYRLIMQKIEVQYFYQAKLNAVAKFELKRDEVIAENGDADGVLYHTCEIPVHDEAGNHLCTAYTTWQLKPWDTVKTKV